MAEKNKHREAQLSKRWQTRIKSAQSDRATVIAKGAEMLATIRGSANEEIATELATKFQNKTGVSMYYPMPIMPSWINALIPTILRTSPSSMVQPNDAEDDLSIGIARCQTKLLGSIWRDQSRLIHNQLAVMQSIYYGVGAIRHDFDVHANRPSAVHLDTRCLLLDRFGTQAPGTMAWIGYEDILDIDVARNLFGKSLESNLMSMQGDGQQTPMTVDPMASGLSQVQMTSAYSQSMIDAANERYKVVVIYERAGTPEDESIRLADLKRDPDENGGFSGRDRKLTFDAYTFKLLKEEPWGFTLNRGEFPITLIWPTLDPENPWAYSLLDPVKRLQELVDLCMSLVASDAKQASRTVNLVDETRVADGPQFVTDLGSGKQHMNAKTTGGVRPEDVFSSKRLFEPDDSSLRTLDVARRAFDDVTNRPGLMSSEGLGYSTATGAEVAQQRTSTSVRNPTIAVERALREEQVKDLQIAASKMTGEDVKLYCGSLVGNQVVAQGTEDEVTSYEFWPENLSVREIRSIDVWIQPNSTLETSGQERARTIMELVKALVEFVSASASVGLQVVPEKYAELFSGPIKAAVRELNMPEVEQMIDRGITGLFMMRPDAQPMEEQAATKGEVQQAMGQMGQEFGAALQQFQQQIAQQFQQVDQKLEMVAKSAAQSGEAITALAESIKQLTEVVKRHEVELGAASAMVAPEPPMAPPPMVDPMAGMMPEPAMAMNSVGGLGLEPGMP